MKKKFEFYEIVTVASTENVYAKINGMEGVVIGMAQDDDGHWVYAVDVGDDGWAIEEEHLIATGKFSSHESFYDEADRVTVIVDKDGKGEIK